MKKYIRSLLLNIYARILRLMRTTKDDGMQGISILILPPGEFGSLGDEAMVTGIVEYLKDKGATRVGLISGGLAINWDNHFNPDSGDMEICHHSLSNSWKSWFEVTRLFTIYDQFYCLGADVMDGKYSECNALNRLEYVSLATQTGTPSAILGFSFNEHPAPKVINRFQKLPSDVKLYARDPVSQKRLVHHLKRPIELVADLAFILHPATNLGPLINALKWIENEKINGRIVIGINANSQIISNPNQEAINKLVKSYIDALTQVDSNNLSSFVLVPHDFRNSDDNSSDIALSEAIWKALPLEIQSHCLRLPTPFSAGQIKSLAGNLDLALSSRMHFAIACLGQEIPVACIIYQGKFEGLFSHFELEGMLVKPEEAFQDGMLGKFIISLIEKREDIRRHIQRQLPKIQELALANLSKRMESE